VCVTFLQVQTKDIENVVLIFGGTSTGRYRYKLAHWPTFVHTEWQHLVNEVSKSVIVVLQINSVYYVPISLEIVRNRGINKNVDIFIGA